MPNAKISAPVPRLIHVSARIVTRDRSAATTAVRITHQSVEPHHTPSVISAASIALSATIPEPGERGREREDRHRVRHREAVDRDGRGEQPGPVGGRRRASRGRLVIVRQPRYSRNAPPISPSTTRAPTSTDASAARPNAAIPPYVPSANATPIPDARPYTRPCSSVRRIVSSVIGPTPTAIANPIASPRRKEQRIHQALTSGGGGDASTSRRSERGPRRRT